MAWAACAGSVYYNDVSDYILRDRAHGQSGILQDDNATIYRNVDAQLYGFEMEAGIRWGSFWSSRATLAYVHARNSDDSRTGPGAPRGNSHSRETQTAPAKTATSTGAAARTAGTHPTSTATGNHGLIAAGTSGTGPPGKQRDTATGSMCCNLIGTGILPGAPAGAH